MRDDPDLAVLRLGHRPGRDERTTTHVGLTARALGADRVVLAGDGASRAATIVDVTERFGGPFTVETTADPQGWLASHDGRILHLTMYGLPIQTVTADVRAAYANGEPLAVVVGAEKVSFDVYERADWNVAVTNQPHSEIAALAVTLDRLFEGRELEREWVDADRVVRPQETGKRVDDT